jgi:hypothetical protein
MTGHNMDFAHRICKNCGKSEFELLSSLTPHACDAPANVRSLDAARRIRLACEFEEKLFDDIFGEFGYFIPMSPEELYKQNERYMLPAQWKHIKSIDISDVVPFGGLSFAQREMIEDSTPHD